MTPSRVIGKDGGLPWHLPADLAFFKRTTTGHPVVMGRTTCESIGRPLPNRRNIVLTRNPDWSLPGVETIHRPDALFTLPGIGPRVFIIGGAAVYQEYLPFLDELLVSHIVTDHPGDTRFPPYEDDFTCVETVESHPDFIVRRWVSRS
jgi:dihydrofolate reductase